MKGVATSCFFVSLWTYDHDGQDGQGAPARQRWPMTLGQLESRDLDLQFVLYSALYEKVATVFWIPYYL